MIKPP